MTTILNKLLNRKDLLQTLTNTLLKDQALHLHRVTSNWELFVQKIPLVKGEYTNLSELEKSLTDRGLKTILLADDYQIWSKDLAFKAKNRSGKDIRVQDIVVQACIWTKHKSVVFRMYERPTLR
jgi:hypothetical protein